MSTLQFGDPENSSDSDSSSSFSSLFHLDGDPVYFSGRDHEVTVEPCLFEPSASSKDDQYLLLV